MVPPLHTCKHLNKSQQNRILLSAVSIRKYLSHQGRPGDCMTESENSEVRICTKNDLQSYKRELSIAGASKEIVEMPLLSSGFLSLLQLFI